ncbi:MAG TPA: DUF433 domain-containing protein [Tepidisphaeraceae bacterium]|jgi:uncharacterized protein (DUF433 family)|nr:DUF433 domain-containing protein [Tepidisphaeraceae bacterium]
MDRHNPYVRTDKHGVMRVVGTHVMLDSVLAAFEQGHSPETIRSQYPSLTLEQVYGSIAYYLAHRDEAEEYLRRQDALWAKSRAEAEAQPNPARDRLRALKGQRP